ncbi:MAG: hypothetical protein JW953_07925 [Anaerolineae bacterium]|nr:hypothetical protein [Anaerolineae bacterium]
MQHKTLFKLALFGGALVFLGLLGVNFSAPVAAQDPSGDLGIQAVVSTAFVYQGQLSDGGGPVTDTCDFTFGLFDAVSGGTQIASTVNANGTVVTNGAFAVVLDFGDTAFTGDARYLEITVNCGGGATTLSPRQELHAVPYALSLRPGAKIVGTDTVLEVTTSGSNSKAVLGSATGGANPAGVYGTSSSSGGRGVFGEATSTTGSNSGVRGVTQSTDSNATGVYGLAISSSATGTGVKGQNNGTNGYAVWGQGGNGATGVLGQANSSTKYGVWAYNSGTGVALRVEGAGTLIEAWDMSPVNVRFRVDNAGGVFSDVGYSTPAADFAEMLPAVDRLEPADVLVIGPDGKLTRSTEAYQPTVMGVYSTEPGFVGGFQADTEMKGQVPLAVVGVVPVKASAENGPIQPGDMLVAANIPGHAMNAGDEPPQGTVIGKALAGLDEGTGVIQMLVILQ